MKDGSFLFAPYSFLPCNFKCEFFLFVFCVKGKLFMRNNVRYSEKKVLKVQKD